MIKVERGNVVLRVDDSLMQMYVDKGYTAKTLDGVVIKRAIPATVGELRKAYIEHTKKIAELEAEIASLKAGKTPEKTKEPEQVSDTVVESVPVVKRSRKKSTEQ